MKSAAFLTILLLAPAYLSATTEELTTASDATALLEQASLVSGAEENTSEQEEASQTKNVQSFLKRFNAIPLAFATVVGAVAMRLYDNAAIRAAERAAEQAAEQAASDVNQKINVMITQALEQNAIDTMRSFLSGFLTGINK